jgi:hypothetical protein
MSNLHFQLYLKRTNCSVGLNQITNEALHIVKWHCINKGIINKSCNYVGITGKDLDSCYCLNLCVYFSLAFLQKLSFVCFRVWFYSVDFAVSVLVVLCTFTLEFGLFLQSSGPSLALQQDFSYYYTP